MTSSTLSANSANFGSGGGITNQGALTVTNSTFTGNNDVNGNGGGIYNNGKVTVTNSTITGNSAGANGGGFSNGGMLTVTNTIVAGNTAASTGPDVVGTIISGGHNLIGMTDGSTGFTGAGDQTGTVASPLNPHLGALGSNGGTTQTIPLLAGSPAIAHGDPAVCNTSTGTAPVNHLDQRGVIRPAALCAIGAFEPLLSAISSPSGPIAGGATVTLTGAGFVAGATVSIGGVAVRAIVQVNSTTLTCTTGAHGAGAVDVVVTVAERDGDTNGRVHVWGRHPAAGAAAIRPRRWPTEPAAGDTPSGPTGGPAPNPLPVPRPPG